MLEKRIPIPFLGKELSAWLYRSSNYVKENPKKSGAFIAFCAAGWIWYESNVVRKNQLVSPTVNNHLVYDVKRVKAEDVNRTEIDANNVRTKRQLALEQRNEEDASALGVLTTADPEKREEFKKIVAAENELDRKSAGSAMVVKSGQLYVREPHWQIRNNERNWVIMSRDQQQQKDHYWYRTDRSRDDDYGRNTYSK